MDKIEFHCDICLSGFDNQSRYPRILSCGHTFCHRCIQRLINEISPCPKCGGDIHHRTAKDAVANCYLLEKQSRSSTGLDNPLKSQDDKDSYEGHCLEHSLPNHFLCMKCNVLLCGTCVVLNHSDCKTIFKVSDEALHQAKSQKCSKLKTSIDNLRMNVDQNWKEYNEMNESIRNLKTMIEAKETLCGKLLTIHKEMKKFDQISEILKAEDITKRLMQESNFDFDNQNLCKVDQISFIRKVSFA